MSLQTKAIRVLDDWYNSLDRYQDKLPAKGSIAAALHVLGRLKAHYDLNISSHIASGGSQICGLSAASLAKVLSEFGETRPLTAVAGRSNRGARGDIELLLAGMVSLHLETKSEAVRNEVLSVMQGHIVTSYVSLYFSAKRVKATFDRSAATWQFIRAILENAALDGKAGAVAEYLVGAKLVLRFPGTPIRNKRFSTSDAQSGFSGDFEIGNTAFHVTVAPMPGLFDKCKANLERGLRVYMLVLENQVVGARQTASVVTDGNIAIQSIEYFIATNIDELCDFDEGKLKSGLLRLLEEYNRRVEAVELDKSMLIEIPPNLI
jgi:hypothetical protein